MCGETEPRVENPCAPGETGLSFRSHKEAIVRPSKVTPVEAELLQNPWFAYLVLPLLIFLARVLDVSIGTIRLIFVSRGLRVLAPILGFFEILIWLIAIGQIMKNLTEWYYYIAYSGGFAAGTWIGIWIEQKLALGVVTMRVITRNGTSELIDDLRGNNYGVTLFQGEGSTGKVNLIYMLLARQDLKKVIATVKKHNPNAFYLVEDVRFAQEGVFPPSAKRQLKLRKKHLHVPRPKLRNLQGVHKKK